MFMKKDTHKENIKTFKKDMEKATGKEEVKKPKKDFFSRLFKKNDLVKSNKVAVVLLRNNNLAKFLEVEAKDNNFLVENKKFHTDKDCIYATEKDRIPLAIIREWDLIPLGTKEWYDKVGDDEKMRETFARLEQHVLSGIKNAELYKYQDSATQMPSMKQMIGWGLVILVGGIILFNYI